MTRIVLDTNILVSALWSPQKVCAQIVESVLTDRFQPCYNDNILREYAAVLRRGKFGFSPIDVDRCLDYVVSRGLRVDTISSDLSFADESDRKFYDVALAANAYLITGNAKHFPKEPFVVSPSDFLSNVL